VARRLDRLRCFSTRRERCQEAGIGDTVEFATKPKLAQNMLERLLNTDVDLGWFIADEAYGDNPGLRAWLAEVLVRQLHLSRRPATPTGSWNPTTPATNQPPDLLGHHVKDPG